MRTRWSGQREGTLILDFKQARNRREWLGKLAKIKRRTPEPPETIKFGSPANRLPLCGGESGNFKPRRAKSALRLDEHQAVPANEVERSRQPYYLIARGCARGFRENPATAASSESHRGIDQIHQNFAVQK